MRDAAVWTFIVSASAFTFGSVLLSYRRLHHNDAMGLRRHQHMIDVLGDSIRPRRNIHPLDYAEESTRSPTSAISENDSGIPS